MYLIDSANAVAQPPAPKAAGAFAGWFQDENPTNGTGGTVVEDDWLNMVQGELYTILQAAGVTCDQTKTLRNQVRASLGILFGGGGSVTSNGWQQLPGGLIVQWINNKTSTGNQDSFVFPTAFPNNLFSATVCEENAVGWGSAARATVYGTTRYITNPLAVISVSTVLLPGTSGGAATYSSANFNLIALGN